MCLMAVGWDDPEVNAMTIRWIRPLHWALALAACDGSAVAPDAAPDAPIARDAGTPIDPRFDALATAIEADLARNNATGASVAVWLDEEIVWVGGFGAVDPTEGVPEGTRPPDEETLFMIGSDTKKIAAILYLQDVHAGTASLDTTIAEVLPDLVMARAPDFVSATAHELLSHQGGIVDMVGDLTSSTTDAQLRAYTHGELAELAYPLAPPGELYNYSNPNFSLAGLMTETLAGRPWADLATERVFAPLGMTHTFARKSDVYANRAVGVGYDSASDTIAGPVSFENTWESAFVRPAGLVWSTPTDQLRLARFLVDGDEAVLPSDLTARIHAPHVRTNGDLPGEYGYGLFVGRGISTGARYYDVPYWAHGGNTLTHTSTLFILPEQRFAISILSNGLGDDFTASLVAAIETLVELPPAVSPPEPPFDPSALDGLTGDYHDAFNVGRVIVARDGDGLRVSAPDLDAAGVSYEPELARVSTRVWIATLEGQTFGLRFVDGTDGSMYLANRGFVAIRPPADARPDTRALRRRPDLRAIERMLRAAEREPVPRITLVQWSGARVER
jgi:CubicO group peptidase (beta-lactamase class C family)